ncbi:MAG: rod shape-determining protein MreC [Nitrospirota bacterium]
MFRSVFTHRGFLFFFLLFIIVLFVVSPKLQKSPIYIIEKPISVVIYPFFAVFNKVVGGFGNTWSDYVYLLNVKKENKRLHLEINGLQATINSLKEEAEANKRLEKLLEFKRGITYQVSAAKVIGGSSTNWYKAVLINKGEKDGIRVDMGIITALGVVGKIIKVFPDYSQVLLMTDRNSAIAGLIQTTRDKGIIEGMEGGHLRMKYLPFQSEVIVGDVVVTSGLLDDFPKGLMIGTISSVKKGEIELFQEVEVIPTVDFSKLEEVLVVVGSVKGVRSQESGVRRK